jgi:antitoxin component YwqK of YwqJK toxin-antitoxin module
MRRTTFIILILFLAFIIFRNSVLAQVSIDTTYSEEDHHITSIARIEGKAKTVTYFYQDGTKRIQQVFVKDKTYLLEGSRKEWYPSGVLTSDENYHKGHKTGSSKYYDGEGFVTSALDYEIITINKEKKSSLYHARHYYWNGHIKSETNYKNGVKNGKETEWYYEETKQSETNYKNGYTQGKSIFWSKKGTIMRIGNNDTITQYGKILTVQTGYWKSWSHTGEKLSENNYLKGKKNGLCILFWPTGIKREEIIYKNDLPFGKVTRWFNDGKLQAKYTVFATMNSFHSQEEKFEGSYEEYYPGGKPRTIGSYAKDNIKIGTWKYYMPDYIYMQEEYKNDTLMNETQYFPDGKIKTLRKYSLVKIDGKIFPHAEGNFITYFPDGKTKEEGFYKEGRKIGTWKTYHPNGQLMKEVLHENNTMKVLRTFDEGGKEIK